MRTILWRSARLMPPLMLAVTACTPRPPGAAPLPLARDVHSVIPLPVSVRLDTARSFIVDTTTTVHVDESADTTVAGIARYVITMLKPLIRSDVQRRAGDSLLPAKGIYLRIDSASVPAGAEAYELSVTPDTIRISARAPAGLFYGVQTLRQLLPISVEHPAALRRRLAVPGGRIADAPRFEWRGMMIDVSRHFLGPNEIKRFIDHLALYKLNRLHLHLADDQGWRIDIQSRPNLAKIGGSTEVGGGPGGYYTQDEYRDIVAHAASRFITIVPEIDMPGHTNAALASYPELNCDNVSPPLYTGIRVGFSALCVDSARIYPVLDDIVREISALTPGPYFHIGGDEVEKLTPVQYRAFIERMQTMVTAHGKRMIGWGEIAPAQLSPATIVQNWKKDSSAVHAARGGKVILSPSAKIYLDQKYDSATLLGLNWAGFPSVRISYEWDPATFIPGVPESAILGLEAPLWSETLVKPEDWEYMAFPRVIAVAELGWTSATLTDWNSFRRRLDSHERRLSALGINAAR